MKYGAMKSLSCVQLFATPWTVTHQAPPSMGFPRHEYWSGLPFPSPGDLPSPWIEPGSPALQTDVLSSEPPGKPMARKMSFYQNITRDSSKYSFPKASAGQVVCVCVGHELLREMIIMSHGGEETFP